MVHLQIFLITKISHLMVHCKHEYEPSIQQRQVQYGKVKKSHEHNSRGIAVFCLPHFVDNLCYLFVSSGAKKYLSPAGNQEGKKSDADTRKPNNVFRKKHKNKFHLEMLGFEPRTFCMQSRRSTTELHPLPGCLGLHRVVNEDTVIAATRV